MRTRCLETKWEDKQGGRLGGHLEVRKGKGQPGLRNGPCRRQEEDGSEVEVGGGPKPQVEMTKKHTVKPRQRP